MANGIQIGSPPNPDDTFWLEQANKTAPDKTLERLDAHGKFLFSTVSLVGTLLTGFGIFGSVGSPALRSPLFLIPISLACVSLALAMMGLTPRVEEINRQDIISIRAYFNDLIKRRGTFIRYAGILFALSILSAAVILVFSYGPGPETRNISIRMTGADKSTLSTKMEFQDLPPLSRSEMIIEGLMDEAKPSESKILFRDRSYADSKGKLTLSTDLDQVQTFKRLIVHVVIMSGDKAVYQDMAEVRR